MAESAKIKQSIESFKQYLSEVVKDKEAIIIGEDSNIHLAGVVGIVQEVTDGLIPLFIGRTGLQLAQIQKKLKAANLNYLTILDNKHNLTDDEPRNEQIVFEWGMANEVYPEQYKIAYGDNTIDETNAPIMVKSSFNLVGAIKHRGFPKSVASA